MSRRRSNEKMNTTKHHHSVVPAKRSKKSLSIIDSSKKRKLVIPQSLSDLHEKDAFEWDAESFVEGCGSCWRIHRPLPLLSTLATTARVESKQTPNNASPPMPLLQSFLSALGHDTANNTGQKETISVFNEENSNENNKEILPMENPCLSTMTEGQHARLLQLRHTTTTAWNHAKRKEYKKLLHCAKREQALYHKAVDDYMDSNLETFLVGIDTMTTRWNNGRMEQYKQQWNKSQRSLFYGKCTQTISLPYVHDGGSAATTTVPQIIPLESLVLDNQVLHTTTSELPIIPPEYLKKTPTCLTDIIKDDDCVANFSSTLLQSDAVARDLADKHRVDIVTCKETLQTMLQSHPYIIPTTKFGSTTWLEPPVPQSELPRRRLEQRYQHVLYQWLCRGDCTTANEKASAEVDNAAATVTTPKQVNKVQYVYTLVTIRNKKSRGATTTTRQHGGGIKVLVRSANRVLIHGDSPLCWHAQLDYFENRPEEYTSFQKASWILDKVLQPSSRVVVGRICVVSNTLLGWEETSIANALVETENDDHLGSSTMTTSRHCHPMQHWSAMVHLLNSIPTMEECEQVLCFPGRNIASLNSCVSVHNKLDKEKVSGNGFVIDLQRELDQAKSVSTDKAALQQCVQPWKWLHPDRIPYTFPTCEKRKEKTDSSGRT